MPQMLIRNDNPVLTVSGDEEKLEFETIQHVQRSYTRHDVAHGLLQAEACNERIGALLFLLFLRLSALKRVGSGPSPL